MNAVTDEKKIKTVQAQSKLNEHYLACKTAHMNVEFKHWTSGKDHKPIKDEIIVHEKGKRDYVLLGLEYDDQGYIGAVYKTDRNGKRSNLNVSSNIQEHENAEMMSQRTSAIKKTNSRVSSGKSSAIQDKKPAKRVTSQTRKVIPQRDPRLS